MTKKILLTSVCRPLGPRYGDAPSVGYELLNCQVTRAQGIFSPRTVNANFALEYIAENLGSPTVVLQYPSRQEFIRELKNGYDYVGISFIMALFHRMKEMVALVREHAPQAKIVLGGYGTILTDEELAPYADYICREEGVGFFRRLLNEPPIPMPYQHPLLVDTLKVFSLPTSRTGKIFAGLGCPNGCDFCCTSHFYKRRHIRLLPDGKDIYDVLERYRAMDPDLVFLIIDEDFLLNRKRAMEFRDCVLKSGKIPSIFVFSSIKAISQYTVEEILEMGIDGFWIGYEGSRSGYAKQQGRPVEEIFTEFRAHGITILASMILGFDYQTPEIVTRELHGLLRLKPCLTQFLIYGPVPGTPFGDRVRKTNLMHEQYLKDPDLLYRRADGFTTTMKHPTLSAAQIEELQRWCFHEDFQRLGPSIIRFLETRLLGHQKLKHSPNPALRDKARHYARELRNAYPVFLAAKLFGPNRNIRRWTREVERQIHDALGRPTFTERLKSVAAIGAAIWTKSTLAFHLFQHPRLTRTEYRLPAPHTNPPPLWERIPHEFSIPDFSIRVELQHARQQVWLRLEGVLSAHHADRLAQHLQHSLANTKTRLVLDLNRLHWEKPQNLAPLREKLLAYRSRIQLVLPRLSAAHPELLLLAAVFQSYKG